MTAADQPSPGFLGRLLRVTREADAAMQYGRALGLTKEETQEVLGAWIEHNMLTGLSWNRANVQRSMESRHDGRTWDPRAGRFW